MSLFRKKKKGKESTDNFEKKIEAVEKEDQEIEIIREEGRQLNREKLLQEMKNGSSDRISKPKTKEEYQQYIADSCEQIVEASNQMEDARLEYQVVTEYLMDIQKIDEAPEKVKSEMIDNARQMLTLMRERNQYQKSELRSTDPKFYGIRRYQSNMLEEIKKMQEEEKYQRIVKNDLHHLESEKKTLLYQRNDIAAGQKFLKKIAMSISVLIVSLFVLFWAISAAFQSDMTIPYIMTIVMAAGSAAYIFLESRKNKYQVILIDKKINKAIGLLNKIKIKYVNNTSVLDYACSKFNVKSSMELQYLWEQYQKALEEERRYQNNTERLNYYREELLGQLEDLQIQDIEIWVSQAEALIDSKEMVEIRHTLNVRRQKLRERIGYNTKLRDNGFEEIKNILNKKPDIKDIVIDTLRQYQIELEHV